MKIKLPPIYDVSHYEEIPDFEKVSPRPAIFITKATEGATYRDDKFIRFFAGMSKIGVVRGCYHFFRKAYSSAVQAQFFTYTIRPYITKRDLLILDVEEGGETAEQLEQWLIAVQKSFPDNRLLIYSRENLLRNIAMTSAQKAFFRNIPVWIAGYPLAPDLYDSPPSSYVPDQSKWGKVVLWQYSDKGIVTGIQGNVDVNWVDPVFLEEVSSEPIPPPPSTEDKLIFEREYFTGAIERAYETITTHGLAIYHLTEIKTSSVGGFFVSPQLPSRMYVPAFLEQFDLDIAVNCGGWTSPPLVPTGYNVSDGQPYGTLGGEETIFIDKENRFSVIRNLNSWNAFSFQNRLVWEGIIPPINKTLNDIRARTAIGWTQAQDKVYLLTVDGGDQYSKEGLNFQETAAILKKLNCYYGVMLDGGGSTTKAINDHGAKIVGLPSGEDFVIKYGANLRRVINVLGVRMKTGAVIEPPPTGENMYKVLIAVKPRIDHSMYANSAVDNLAVGTEFEVSSSFTVNDPTRVDNGVTFVQIVGGAYNQYWVPLIYKGVEYVKAITVNPPEPNITYTATIKDDVTGEIWSGTLTKQ